MSWDTDLAKKFKQRENPASIGNIVGKVISPLPDLQISILDAQVILRQDQLYCCDSVLADYSREFSSTSTGSIITTTDDTPPITSDYVVLKSLTNTGTITFTDTLVAGDLVLLIPAQGEQIWFIVDKITKL
jgi:hypothetical protein